MSELDFGKIWPEWEYAGLLGEGAFGKVYLAKSELDGAEVYSSVKVLKIPANEEAVSAAKQLGVSEDLLRTYFGKFKNDLNWELTMFKSASDPAIAGYDDVVLMDNEDGVGWRGYIRSGLFTPMSAYFSKNKSTQDDAVRMGRDIADAVEVCGSFGMIHGGICPENIMVTDSGKYVLKDFGIRRCLKRAGSNLFGGISEDFDAPEVKDGGRYTNSSDIYSLGMCLAFVAAGGKLPEDGNIDGIPGLTDDFKEIIKRATATLPEYRYQSAADLKSDLERVVPISPSIVRRAAAVSLALDTVRKNGTAAEGAADKTPKAEAPGNDSGPEKESAVNRTEKKRGGRKIASVVAAFAVVACCAAALYTLRPWESLGKEPDPTPGQTITEPSDEDKTPLVDKNTDMAVPFAIGGGAGSANIAVQNPDDINQGGDGQDTEPSEPDTEPSEPEPEPEPTPTPDPEPEPTPTPDPEPEPEPDPEPEPEPTPDPEPEEPYERQVQPYQDIVIFNTDEEYITREFLDGLTRDETYMVLNEIYARHGKIFSTRDIQDYFESQYWYEPVTRSSEETRAAMTDIESENLQFIVAYQKEMGYR